MKNTEWGAVAYLSFSKYEINSEVNINNNSNKLTGYSATLTSDQSTFPGTCGTSSDITLPYNTETTYYNRIIGDAIGEMGPFYNYVDGDGNSRYIIVGIIITHILLIQQIHG
jgi:hypothetical protein